MSRPGIPLGEPTATVGRAVRERRLALGLSVAQLAERMGAGATLVKAIEGGSTNVSVERLTALAAALEVDPCDLLEGP